MGAPDNSGVTPPKGSKNQSESINSKTIRNLHSIFQKQANIQKVPKLCANDDLPEGRHLDPDSQALVLKDGSTGGCLEEGYARSRGSGSCSSSWTVDRGQAPR